MRFSEQARSHLPQHTRVLEEKGMYRIIGAFTESLISSATTRQRNTLALVRKDNTRKALPRSDEMS